ncbi:substrate-binding domain-containing protein [Romeria aff. gracilis LEGE 07310]|uniref:Substrate-binding domain-containing protein n=1 Tax=Vasconcelosia minhoensis LEGE 07310 TaxID=915328 RepID=A0A8J7AQP0_9CYAN|nr:substrate-binding domain-containing protein [Romeria gracilis]MBE9078864.1 substrate-binding domain-containing protein [Romeria aff. gracilis LEGE 07310]
MSLPKTATSLAIITAALGLTYAPLPGSQQSITVVSGSELQEPLALLEERFEQAYPDIALQIEIQGSQDIVNNFIDGRNDFQPTVLIPANGQLLDELQNRWDTQHSDAPFYADPQPIARTMLVAIAWPERGQALFPNGQFEWSRLEEAVTKGSWADLGGKAEWGSFDFVTTDPTRSNSGQLALGLWAQSELAGQPLSPSALNSPAVESLFSTVKKSVYQPPRSTDILLQEFITRGPNDADIAIVYESIALHRWEQATTTQGTPYRIYYLDPTVETVSTAAVVQHNISKAEARAGQAFVDFLIEPEQQAVFVQFGFRPTGPDTDLAAVTDSPWNQDIPGAEASPSGQVAEPPNRQLLTEVIRLWQRAN